MAGIKAIVSDGLCSYRTLSRPVVVVISLTGQPGSCLPVLRPEERRVSLPGMLEDSLVLVVCHSETNNIMNSSPLKSCIVQGQKSNFVFYKKKLLVVQPFLSITRLGKPYVQTQPFWVIFGPQCPTLSKYFQISFVHFRNIFTQNTAEIISSPKAFQVMAENL